MIYIGASGWSYPGWEEKLYKTKMTGYQQLDFYAKIFNTVEINYSFYHIPKAETFRKWAAATPEHFTFSVKLNRQFTHVDQLVLTDTSQVKLKLFLKNARELGEKFGALLIQTPKSLPQDLDHLQKFLKTLTDILKESKHSPALAFEFRNESWLNDTTDRILEKFGATMVVAQSACYPERRTVVSDCIYLRLHGPEKIFDSNYSGQQLRDWKTFIDQHARLNAVFIYFNNTMRGRAIDDALYLQKLFSENKNL